MSLRALIKSYRNGRLSTFLFIVKLPYAILARLRWTFKTLSYSSTPTADKSISKVPKLRWWYIYGLSRSGTTYMTVLIRNASKLCVSDWGLGRMLNQFNLIKGIDKDRLLEDLASNILDNANLGQGNQLDLVFKQANGSFEEYQLLVKMFGEPERKIFCFREPAGYIASAQKKFKSTLEALQDAYIRNLKRYEEIGGDIIEYSKDLTLDDYLIFLEPLKLNKMFFENFSYTGESKPEDTTEEMWSVYNSFKEINIAKIYKPQTLTETI